MAAYAGGLDGKIMTRGERIAQARAGFRPTKPSVASGRKPIRQTGFDRMGAAAKPTGDNLF